MNNKNYSIILLIFLISTIFSNSSAQVVESAFIFETAPFKECHASTIEATPAGMAAAWFGGTKEKNPDVGIWISLQINGVWSAPKEFFNGIQDSNTRYACWNPVLFQVKNGPLLLFYKVGHNPDKWWGMLSESTDNGQTWSNAARLPEGVIGPVKNKPELLSNNVLLCPSSTEHDGWRVHMESTSDLGKTWSKVDISSGEKDFQAIQPSILKLGGENLQLLCRNKSGNILQSFSKDNGKTWTPLTETNLPNPNSGTDAVTLKDGRHILVYNPTKTPKGKWGGKRTPLNVAISEDGKKWNSFLELENKPGEYSYPAVIQSEDGKIHITYTWKRKKIKYVVIDPEKIPENPAKVED